tara:strand:+ start:7638 stop:8111 length:474 start_codon:yes stop_codon:yes gene_type:complete
MGVDPGLINTGYGIVSFKNQTKEILDFGIITPDKTSSLSNRLKTIYEDICSVIHTYQPDCISIEEVFYSNNIKTTLKLGQARGAVLIAAAQSEVDIYEYSARKIKLSLTGNGNANKQQVKFMVGNTFNIDINNYKDDASDALAAALCHEQQFRYGDL